MTGLVTLATPDRGSVQVKVTVTGPKLPPKMSGGGLRRPVMVGGVRSTLMLLSVAPAVLPARSTQFPVMDWAAPSAKVTGDGVLATPERVSEQVKLTVTGSLFQPYVLGWTFLELVTLGGVRSIFIPVTEAEALFPALSVHVPAADCP